MHFILQINFFGSSTDDDLKVDFGDVKLGEIVTRYVIVRNESAIPAPYHAHVTYFRTRPPTPPEKRLDPHMPNKW